MNSKIMRTAMAIEQLKETLKVQDVDLINCSCVIDGVTMEWNKKTIIIKL